MPLVSQPPSPTQNSQNFEARVLKVLDVGLKSLTPQAKGILVLVMIFVLALMTVLAPDNGAVKLLAIVAFSAGACAVCAVTRK